MAGVRSICRRLVLGGAMAVLAGSAWALDVQAYSAELLADRKEAGQPVALHFCASWCTTCVAQKQVMADLRDDPALVEMQVLIVDFDEHKALRRTLKVWTPGTIVVFKGAKEVARSTGQTSVSGIWALLGRAM
jgi:thiol-disulfide isomerase/thioredoxin